MPKTLKVIFSGICTYAQDTANSKLYVLASQSRNPRRNAPSQGSWGDGWSVISRHRAFIAGLSSVATSPSTTDPTKDMRSLIVTDDSDIPFNVYLLDNAKVSFPRPTNVLVPTETALNIKGKPGDPGSAPLKDWRWIAQTSDIFSGSVTIANDVDPRQAITNDKLSMVTEIEGGTIEAFATCQVVGTRVFEPVLKTIDPRFLAAEMLVRMEYPDTTTAIDVSVSALNTNEEGPAITSVKLAWPTGSDIIEVRVGNDTLDEIAVIARRARCDGGPAPNGKDNDFELHYDLLNWAGVRPLPKHSGQQGDWGGCVGLVAPLP